MRSISQYCGIGHLTKDADAIDAPNIPGARFIIAVNRGGEEGEADYISCSLWGERRTGPALKHLKKGRLVMVTGRPKISKTSSGTFFEVNVDEYQICKWSDSEKKETEPEKEVKEEVTAESPKSVGPEKPIVTNIYH